MVVQESTGSIWRFMMDADTKSWFCFPPRTSISNRDVPDLNFGSMRVYGQGVELVC